jgi:hypothetical protein
MRAPLDAQRLQPELQPTRVAGHRKGGEKRGRTINRDRPMCRPNAYNPAMAANRRGAFWWLIACWALLGAACYAYRFFWSTFPVTSVDEPAGPTWVVSIGEIVWALIALHALCSVPLLLAGLIRLRRTWRWAVAWASAAAAGLALEVMFVTGFGVPWVSPAYSGPAVLDWAYLAESAGFLLAGTAMVRVLAGATQAAILRTGTSHALQQ